MQEGMQGKLKNNIKKKEGESHTIFNKINNNIIE